MTPRGLASSYAYANCCPVSFFGAWITPGQVSGFPGDVTQFLALRQDETCYGELTAPYETYANFFATALCHVKPTITITAVTFSPNPHNTHHLNLV
ncbi:MAG: hypothetical protein ACRD9R_08280 [Pyrinomonadaceae bacterium]